MPTMSGEVAFSISMKPIPSTNPRGWANGHCVAHVSLKWHYYDIDREGEEAGLGMPEHDVRYIILKPEVSRHYWRTRYS